MAFNPLHECRYNSVPELVSAVSAKDLSATSKLVYGVLCRLNLGGAIFPSHEYLADQVGVGVRQVRYCLRQLRDQGLIEVVKNRGAANGYELVRSPIFSRRKLQDIALENAGSCKKPRQYIATYKGTEKNRRKNDAFEERMRNALALAEQEDSNDLQASRA